MSFEFPRILSFHVHSFSILTCTCLYLKSFAFYVIKILCIRSYVIITVNIYIYITRYCYSQIYIKFNIWLNTISYIWIFLYISLFYLLFLSISKSCEKMRDKEIQKISCCFIFLFFLHHFSLVKRPGADPSFICFSGDLILSSQFLRDQQFARMILFFSFSFSFFFSFTMLSFLYRSWIELVFVSLFLNSTDKELSKLWSNL